MTAPASGATTLGGSSYWSQAPLVVFTLDEQRYGLPLTTVERATHAVEITPLPSAPLIVLGIVNVEGRVMPVVDMRRRFGLPQREFSVSDQMIISRTNRPLILVVDAVTGIVRCSEKQWVAAGEVLSRLDHLEGVVKLEDGLVLVHDLETFLSIEEEGVLAAALERVR